MYSFLLYIFNIFNRTIAVLDVILLLAFYSKHDMSDEWIMPRTAIGILMIYLLNQYDNLLERYEILFSRTVNY